MIQLQEDQNTCFLEEPKMTEPLWFLIMKVDCATPLMNFTSVFILTQFFGGRFHVLEVFLPSELRSES